MFTIFATSGVGGRQQIGAANAVVQQPDGTIHARRTGQAHVCRGQRSSITSKLECIWGSELSVGSAPMPDRRPNTLENIAGEPSQPDASLAQSVCA
jgi:hypothetical protein